VQCFVFAPLLILWFRRRHQRMADEFRELLA